MGWAYLTRGQGGLGHRPPSAGKPFENLGDFIKNETEQPDYSDIIRGTVTINCISKQGLQAEEIANIVFMSLTGFKAQIYKHGIHGLTALQIGEEQILRSNSDIELTAVPVSFSYTMEKEITTSFATADVTLYYTAPQSKEIQLYEGIHFNIENGNTLKTLFTPVVDSDLLVSYKESQSGVWREKQDLIGALDGTNTSFLLPNDESAYGYYLNLSGIDFTYSGLGHTFEED
jgi:hypothetical protein